MNFREFFYLDICASQDTTTGMLMQKKDKKTDRYEIEREDIVMTLANRIDPIMST